MSRIPHRRPRPSFLGRFRRTGRPAGDRGRSLGLRLAGLRRASRSPDLPSDHRAFLLLALSRFEGLLASLPGEVRDQPLCLSWQESIVAGLERQAGGLPLEASPFGTTLPTTVAEERRRTRARAVLEAAGERLRTEREELLASLDEVERDL